VTVSRTRRDGKEQLPTRFVAEMAEETLVRADTEPYEKEWAAHPERAFAEEAAGTPDIDDREFIATLFAEQGLSATALDNFLACPWKWLYLNLLRIPEAPNKHLMYGNAVHEALKAFFDGFGGKDGKDVIRLIGHFERALADQPIGERDFDEALAKGKKSLAAWHAAYASLWPKACVTERRVTGIMVGTDVPISGKIDKIECTEGGAGVNVVDYKTGRPKSRNAIEGKTADGSNYRRQLVFYRLLLEREGQYNMVSGDIDFVEPDEKGVFHKERFAVGKEDAAELEAVIVKAAAEIRNMSFWNTYCADPDCAYCALRKAITTTRSKRSGKRED
jgi:CRISPR/Cas system-associated exonuclease Cas4 (RecB family)